jgi:hypothetical protein
MPYLDESVHIERDATIWRLGQLNFTAHNGHFACRAKPAFERMAA